MSLFGGVWADRHDRKRLIIAADGAIALSTLVLAGIMLAGFVGIVMAVAAPVGMVVFGPLADVVSVEAILVVTGLLTFAVVGLALWLPAGRRAAVAARLAARQGAVAETE